MKDSDITEQVTEILDNEYGCPREYHRDAAQQIDQLYAEYYHEAMLAFQEQVKKNYREKLINRINKLKYGHRGATKLLFKANVIKAIKQELSDD